MSRQAPESSLDHYAASLQSGMFALRGYMLHERSKAVADNMRKALESERFGGPPVYLSDYDRRIRMLKAMGDAYVARGLAVEHRLAGSTATAMRLETQSEDLLAEARRICSE